MSARTRDEHLAWAKERALAYVEAGELANAFASMLSDLGKHAELRTEHVLAEIGMLYVIQLDAPGMRRWIEGFN